ncbi:Sperm-associated antigen 17 [Physocladia obscura]|uniref:Sperm-associated antigen 17 n=1 Tax=Physocladia obscura TaxID=109957 RepID=A0AAD5SVS5_9FUNG|nr:Sperm-associated antigen 17 [Physocladia obscura]
MELCRDIKTGLDASGGNDGEMPDILMAKLIKARLFQLKQDAIDSRNNARAFVEAPVAQVQLTPEVTKSGVKAAGKDEKGKDRAKSPAKKPLTKGGDRKMVEPLSRPESAQTAEISKRKNKLRDKGTKDNMKIPCIGDEPADGPNAYYLLKDFTNMGVFNCLMEDCEIPIHSFFRLSLLGELITDSIKSPSQTPLQSIEIQSFDMAKFESLVSTNRLLIEAYEWCKSANEDSLWSQSAWNDAIISGQFEVKEVFDVFARRIYAQLKLRKDFADYYSFERVINIPSFVNTNGIKNDSVALGNFLDIIPYNVLSNSELILAVAIEQAIRSHKYDEEFENSVGLDQPPNFGVVDEMGHLANYFDKAFKKISFKATNDSNDCTILLRNLKLEKQTNANDPLISRERVANLSKLRKKHSGVAFNDILRVLYQNQLEEILSEETPHLWNLNDWVWEETLDKNSMLQISTKLCNKTGKLLIAMTGDGGIGIKKSEKNEKIQILTKVNFGIFHELMDHFKSLLLLPPKTKSSLARPPIYYSGGGIVHHHDDCTIMYPSNGSRIVVHREHTMNFKPDIRTSFFVFSTTDKETVLACPGGLILEFKEDGRITQKLDSIYSVQSNSGALSCKELSRVIMLDGAVARYMSNSAIEAMLPTGTTSVLSNNVWVTTNNDGERIKTFSSGETVELPPIRVNKETLIALNELIVTREDMVVTTNKNGTVIVEHADGTMISSKFNTDATAASIVVEKPDSPMYTIKEGGKKVLIKFDDGTTVEQQNGDQKIFKIFNKTYAFEFELYLGGESAFRFLPERATENLNSEYKINWKDGTFSTVNDTGVKFSVDEIGNCFASETVPSQPISTEKNLRNIDFSECEYIKKLLETRIASTNSIHNPPKLFIINDDGSGVQLHRDIDLQPYFKVQIQNSNVEIVEEAFTGDGLGISVTFIEKIHLDLNKKQGSAHVVEYRQLFRYQDLNDETRKKITTDLFRETENNSVDEVEQTYLEEGRDTSVVLGQDRLQTHDEIYENLTKPDLFIENNAE